VTLISLSQLRLPTHETAIPRLRDEPFLVNEYAQAFRLYDGWGEFPPIVVDQEMLVLSGVHRTLAAIEAGLDEAEAEIRECGSDAERLLIAIEENARHGKGWSTKDRTRIVILAERMGIETTEIAHALRIRVEKVQRIPVTTVARRRNGQTEEVRVYAKQSVRASVRGRLLTEREAQLMASISTPHPADTLLVDLLRIDELDALPVLSQDSAQTVVRSIEILSRWLERDRHALEAT